MCMKGWISLKLIARELSSQKGSSRLLQGRTNHPIASGITRDKLVYRAQLGKRAFSYKVQLSTARLCPFLYNKILLTSAGCQHYF